MTIQVRQVSETNSLESLNLILGDENGKIGTRFMALFQLKAMGTESALQVMKNALKTSSILLKHEIYYCLGQMQSPLALEILLGINEPDEMAEHEQMEALGCYPPNLEIIAKLKAGLSKKSRVVRETCELALRNLDCDKDKLFNSIDPSPALATNDLQELKRILLDTKLELFERYKAIFALRNLNTTEAVEILALGFEDDSALFRHEIAFVFGQMRQESSIPSLIRRVEDLTESGIVRHESVEALGSIGTTECCDILKKYLKDENQVVRESCEVGLDMVEYENNNEFITVTV